MSLMKTRILGTTTQAKTIHRQAAARRRVAQAPAIESRYHPVEQASAAYGPIQVMLACDSDSTFKTALQVYGAIVLPLGRGFEFQDSLCQFGALANRVELDRAAQLAAEADIIFCCPGDQAELPPVVLDWIGLWTARRNQKDGALAVLLPTAIPNPPRPSPIKTYLAEVARTCGLAFFSAEYVAALPQHSGAYASERMLPYGEDFVVNHTETKPEVRHWGINE